MNKRKLSKIISLYKDGVSPEVCASSIIEMSKSKTEAGIFITKFFKQTMIESLDRENRLLHEELDKWKEAERRLKDAIELSSMSGDPLTGPEMDDILEGREDDECLIT